MQPERGNASEERVRPDISNYLKMGLPAARAERTRPECRMTAVLEENGNPEHSPRRAPRTVSAKNAWVPHAAASDTVRALAVLRVPGLYGGYFFSFLMINL